MREVKKIAQNDKLFYSYRINSIMSMGEFFLIFSDDEKIKTEILSFLLDTLKSNPVNISNSALTTLIKVYNESCCSSEHKAAIH